MRILKSILVFFGLLMLIPADIFAQSRRMPGNTVYFGEQTMRTTRKRDQMRDTLNLSIHKMANGNHAKSMAIRAYLYQYCGDQARLYMQDTDIESKGLNTYQQYTYLQTQLYQSLQPTVQKIRVIMNDKNISFPIVLSHLQSNDPVLLYYYGTIPQRYEDSIFFSDIETVRAGLRRFKTANNIYPEALTDLITYKFMPSAVMLSNKKIIYRAYNIPDVMLYEILPPKKYDLYDSKYVLLYHAQHKNNIEYIDTLDNIRKKVYVYYFSTREHIKRTPIQVYGKGVGRKIIISE